MDTHDAARAGWEAHNLEQATRLHHSRGHDSYELQPGRWSDGSLSIESAGDEGKAAKAVLKAVNVFSFNSIAFAYNLLQFGKGFETRIMEMVVSIIEELADRHKYQPTEETFKAQVMRDALRKSGI